jgi:aspartyl-tRNA(Asn)/glutamyl-tRNA(Gln) amidotransferase subunit B
LEEDPGKLIHIGGSIANSQGTLIDYNRSGIALCEIVTNPVIETPEEARIFLNKLRSIVSHCSVADLSMDGAMRVDANISIRGHARVEVKNIGSFKDVEKALRWEIKRQRMELMNGHETVQETRHFDGRTTAPLRQKESENEYKYFPEADLVPIEIIPEWIEKAKNSMPELPDARIIRLQKTYGLNEYDSDVIVSEKEIADFYESTCKINTNYQAIKNWLTNDIMGLLNEKDLELIQTKITPKIMAEMVEEIDKGTITVKIAKQYIPEILNGIGLKVWLKKQGVKKITDEALLSELADKAIKNNPSVVQDLKAKPRTFEFFVGEVMKETKGQADIDITRKILKEKLKDSLP